ncbi:MFS transporter [Bradyrhizobium sp. SSBR45G]|uniref:MFS transporter n=1 Tax=unclassified Bradyrhizobium TaxID=2631580 RepID=UPI0023429851|nr:MULTISPECIES: MFS transporter [unclassified Bradyrhizobium]GLH81930.1 MFS transporter [Bradyrhizobium sp. SSBR45G]GLH89409.1 MFS transporter [Bradyrhizobium sp. SSBR45R]
MTASTSTDRLARRAALVSFVGSMLEYYDFFIYGTAAALIFPKVFFTNLDPATGTILALMSFGVGYIARPVGAVILGHFGDRIGRKTVLVFTLILMGGSTLAIGLLPDARMIGGAAPILLTLLRLLQGLSAAGEQSGSNSLTLEHSNSGRRAFFTSWTLTGTQAGAILATLVFIPIAALPEDQLLSWGWRVPFLLSFVVLVVAYLVRRTMPETPAFAEIKTSNAVARFPLVTLLREFWPDVLRVIVCALIATVSTVTAVFALGYATTKFGVPRSTMLWAGVLGNATALVTQPMWAILADRIGRKPVFIGGVLGCAVMIFPYFMAITTGDSTKIMLAAMILSGIIYAAPNAIWPSFYAEMFDTRVRYSGTAIGTQLGFLAAGFTPVISQSVLGDGPTGWMPVAIFIAIACVISAAAAATARETHTVGIEDLGKKTPELINHDRKTASAIG